MDKLEPCPFCGDEAEIERMGTHRVSMVYSCTNCGCSLETGEEWLDQHNRWNTRAKTVPLSTQAALECTIEHLDGIHAGKIVVDIDVFNTLYEAARESLE